MGCRDLKRYSERRITSSGVSMEKGQQQRMGLETLCNQSLSRGSKTARWWRALSARSNGKVELPGLPCFCSKIP